MNQAVLKASPSQIALEPVLGEVCAIVPPLWPLADYVAVNPCLGLSGQSFLAARQTLSNVRECDLLMSRDYFQKEWAQGRLTCDAIVAARQHCVSEYSDWFAGFDVTEVFDWLAASDPAQMPAEPRFRTVAEAVDQKLHSTWSSHIVNDITRHCAAHYDEGQAAWVSPWKDLPLYTAWQEAARLGRRMDMLGLVGFRKFVCGLPDEPVAAIRQLLTELAIPRSHWKSFLLCALFSVAGWASYVKNRDQAAGASRHGMGDLVGLLAIRLAYDAALAKSPGIPWPLPLWPADTDIVDGVAAPPAPATDVLARYILQVAMEATYRQTLLGKLASRPPTSRASARKALQMVFCIDVRSEVMRRHLESLSDSIETFGFAGFFGMPLEFVPLGAQSGTAQCPVLLQPSFRIGETLSGSYDAQQAHACRSRQSIRNGRTLWKSFQSSAVSCFSYVEACGLTYLGKLLTDSLRWTKPAPSADGDGLRPGTPRNVVVDEDASTGSGVSLARQCDLGEAMLRNLGLIDGFARIVALCGHASDVTNNPYKAALDCGACGGHSGEPNARVAAAILNKAEVRAELRRRGIVIPDDTWFVAAVHHTTTDEIRFCDLHRIRESHAGDIETIRQWTEDAGRLTRCERSRRFGDVPATDVLRRSQDWAEVRPEWGLAGNAAFIVAPRSRTEGLELGGRTFLHSYDHQRDPQGNVLELIMTAPMIVTNWINLQYYASSVDPAAFGSGNKTIHNVVGQFGVLQGNGGDLMTGLPWQCVHDGEKYQHEPLRLLVVIEAPRDSVQRIIDKHALVRDLATHGWLSLVVWEGDRFYRWTADGAWKLDRAA